MNLCVRFVRGLSIAGFVLGGIVLSSAAVSLTAGVAYAQTPGAQAVNSIVVEGNRRVEASTVRSYFKPGPSGRLEAQNIDDAYKALYATGLFEDVHISQSGGRILVTLVENPVINKIAFEGNQKVKEDQLKLEIQSKERGTLSRATVQSDVQRLIDVYRRGGRFDVRIDPKIIELPNSRVNLVFEITEGEKTVVKTILFVGNHAYSGYRLKDEIKTVETGLLAFLQTTNIYDPDRLEADRELLRRFYLKHGYIDVRIVSAVGEYDPAQQGFVITFTIDEGEQYRIGTVDVRSKVPALNPGLLQPRLRMSTGDVYNAEAIEKSVEDMTIEASRQGFAFATVRPGADRNAQARTINLVFTAEEGQRTYIERINIRGNTKTRDYVVRREFDVAEGDAYNRALINRAERRLKNLNYFKTVKITTEPGSAPDRVVLDVDVEDQSTGEVSLSGGYSTSDGALAEASIGERNLFGLGLAAKVGVTYGQYSKGANFSFVEPYLLGYRLALGLDLYAKEQLPTSFISYQTDTLGAGVRLGVALREDLSLQLRYSIYQQKIVLPSYLDNCNNINPDYVTTFPTSESPAEHPAVLRHRAQSELLRRRGSLAAREGGARKRRQPHLPGRLFAGLQHRRRQSQPDFRHCSGVQPGFGRRRRRCPLPAGDRRLPPLFRGGLRHRGGLAPAGGHHYGMGQRLGGLRSDRRHWRSDARQLPDGPEFGARLRAGRHRPARPDHRHHQ